MDNTQEPTIEDAVDLVWDVCEEVFDKDGDFHSWFISDIEQYFRFLRWSFARILADANGQESGGIGRKLFKNGIDRVALHYRSLRVQENESIAWRRLVFDLAKFDNEPHEITNWYNQYTKADYIENKSKSKELEPPHLDPTDKYYGEKTLPQHIFFKAKKDVILCFEFLDDDEEIDYVNGTRLRIPSSVKDAIIECLDNYRKTNSPSEVEKLLAEKFSQHKSFLESLNKYCEDNLSSENQPKNNEECLQFLLDSSLITLTLLKNNKDFQLPRTFILIPIFVSQDRIGGMAFFSKDASELQKKERKLKYLARNLLSYVSVLESREIEAEKRILEASSPIVHLFVHSFNKAFTTPIRNICTDISQGANLLENSSSNAPNKDEELRSSERLKAIENFLFSFSQRWSGTFAALANQRIENTNSMRFLAIDNFKGDMINQELLRQVQALFAVQLANDIFDFKNFSEYRKILQSLEGINKLVKLDFNIQNKSIPGNKDVILLFLLELVQNAIEALPLGKLLWTYCDFPELLKENTSKFSIEITSREEKDREEKEWIVIQIYDNGRGFVLEILEEFKKYLPEFARADCPPPTIEGIRRRLQEKRDTSQAKSGAGLSNKSGGALGLGILSVADYVARICLVEWEERKEPPDYPDEKARIIQRGKVEIESPPKGQERGSLVQIFLPKQPSESNSVQKKSQRVFLERR